MARISREAMLMEMAYSASKRGTCGRLAVGAIIARDSRPISLGYAGPPKGVMHCDEMQCDLSRPCTRTKHAEENALDFALEHGIDIGGADMFCTDSPCLECASLITGAALKRLYFEREYRNREGIVKLLGSGIEVYHILSNGYKRRLTS